MTTIFDIETWKEITDAGHGGQHNSIDIVASWRRDRDELLIEIAELRGALEQVEWMGYEGSGYCPWCYGFAKHNPKCPRQKALGKV